MRPTILYQSETQKWVIFTYDPDKVGVLKDADSTPTVAVRKNGLSVGDSVSVTKRSATTGIYDCEHNPAGEVEKDNFTIEETVTITGSTTPSATYSNVWSYVVRVAERGTDSALTTLGATAPTNWIDANALATSAGDELRVNIEGSTVLAKESTVTAGFSNTNNLITALNNLSAKMNIFGAPLLEIPDSGSTVYAFTVVVKDDEDKLVNLDASPTIAALNTAAVSRSGNLSAVSNPSTGRYTFTYTVASTHAKESLRITVSGTVSAEARYIEWIGSVVDYDTLTTLQDVQSRVTDLQARTPAALIGGRTDARVGAMATNIITADALATDAVDEIRTNIEGSTILAKEATIVSRASQSSLDTKPTLAQIEASTVLAKDATVLTRLAPTVPNRTVDVTANGNVGVDWGNVENQTSSVNLNSTNIFSASSVQVADWVSLGNAELDIEQLKNGISGVPNALLDTVIENGLTLRECIRIANAVLHADATGLTTSPVFKSLDGTKNRVVGTVTGSNRTISSRDGS